MNNAEKDELRQERDDAVGGYRVAAEAADRFRDVLIRDLRAHFGKTGPEPTRWREFCVGALAVVDQINAERREGGR